jgi:hypothetical protein
VSGITIELTGGLGNQLFILAAGFAQARRLNCHLYIDASRYTGVEARGLEIDEFVIPNSSVVTTTLKNRQYARLAQKVKPFAPFAQKRFVEKSFGYDSNINDVTIGTRMVGYFQSPKYFEGYETEVLRIIQSCSAFKNNKQSDLQTPRTRIAHVHIRRGDYLNPETQDFHGLATFQFFRNADSLLDTLIGPHAVKVFTDSEDLVKREIESLPNWEITPSNGFSPLEVMQKMSRADGFVISNSSFSWWAAWIQSQITATTVIAPRPWFKNRESASDLLLADWITLGAQ